MSLKITEEEINKQIKDELSILALKGKEGEKEINKQIDIILKLLSERRKR